MTEQELYQLVNVPAALKGLTKWVCWQRQSNQYGRVAKIPLTTKGARAAVNRSSTWGEFGAATLAAYNRGYDGVGLVLDGSGLVVIDIDNCLDGGELERRAAAIARSMGSYCEVSPSGKGLHILGRGRKHCTGSRWTAAGLSIEIYDNRRYITITGNVYGGHSSLKDIQTPLDALIREIAPAPAAELETITAASLQAANVDSGELERLTHILLANTGAAALFMGDMTRHNNDHSRADSALMSQLATLTRGRAAYMLALFGRSVLSKREKWEQRADYREYVVNGAIRYWKGRGCKRWR